MASETVMSPQDRPGRPGLLDRLHMTAYLNGQGLLATMADEVRRGLTSRPKSIPPKYFYDERGSELFEQITELPEYYLTRTEHQVLTSMADELMADLRPQEMVELGSGSSTKTRLLLAARSCPSHLKRYVPVDVSESMLRGTALQLLEACPFLEVHGVVGDFERDLGNLRPAVGRRLVLFLGSTIGNLEPHQRGRFFAGVRRLLGRDGRFLLGIDLVKDAGVLHAAYNDSAGVTAEFNRNILRVVNNSLHADFIPDAFSHHSFYNAAASRIEMHLISEAAQVVHIRDLGLTVQLTAGEGIWTENSYKFTRESVAAEMEAAGMRLERWYTDSRQLFGLALAAPA